MKNENNSVKITLIITGAVLLIAILILAVILSMSPVSSNTISVQGVSTIKTMPDLISVNFFIQTRGNTTAEAKDANSLILNELIDSLVAQGFDRSEIQTQNFNIYQDYVWTKDKQTENGFIAYHNVKVELSVNDSDKLDDVVDAGVDAGAGVSSIDFELTRESQNKYKSDALELASQDAKSKADAVAKGLGKNSGKLISVQVSDYDYRPWNVYSGGYATDSKIQLESVASNIQPSEQEISAYVTATFKIR